MFIGHYAVGFAAKKWAPKTSLGTLFMAAIWLDVLWPLFVLLDMEHFRVSPGITKMSPFDFNDYPLSHSLAMSLAWAALWALVYFILERDTKGACIVGSLVVSHWVLDAIVHRPDLPLLPAPGGKLIGLGLWNSAFGTLFVEVALFAAGLWLYLKSTKARDKTGSRSLWVFVIFLLVFYAGSFLGKMPDNPHLIATAGFAQLLFISWAFWFDDHRKSV